MTIPELTYEIVAVVTWYLTYQWFVQGANDIGRHLRREDKAVFVILGGVGAIVWPLTLFLLGMTALLHASGRRWGNEDE
jgi:hypothetical protein